MTHVYEVFTISLVIYAVVSYFYTLIQKKINFSFLIPFLTFLAISVRWVNYHVFFIPLLIKILFRKRLIEKNTLSNNYLFYLSYLLSTVIFLIVNKAIYGIYTINPATVYGNSNKLSSFMEMNLLSMIQTIFISIFKILFSNEFGVFWFSPILFAGLIFFIYFTFISNKHGFILPYYFINLRYSF